MYTSRPIKPIIKAPLVWIVGLKWNVSLDLSSLNSSTFRGFLCVWWINVSQFLVTESNRSSASVLGRIKFKLTCLIFF